jgi:uncharacterized protein (TIGR02271 family)
MTDISGAQPPAGAGYDAYQIAAMFENYAQAKAARDALEKAGVNRLSVEILDQSGAAEDTSFAYERHEEGIWGAIKNLFMPDDHAHLYAEGIRRGYAMLLVRTDASHQERVLSLLEAQNPVDVDTHAAEWRQQGWSGIHRGQSGWEVQRTAAARAAPDRAVGVADVPRPADTSRGVTGGNEEVVPVYEEQLRVGKRQVGRGSVRVRSFVVETPVQEQVRLHEERINIERRPVDRPVSGIEAGAVPFQDRTVEVTATAEEAVVAKETRIKEEIVVRKEEEERTQTVSDTVRHTEVEIDDDRASAVNALTPKADPRRPI